MLIQLFFTQPFVPKYRKYVFDTRIEIVCVNFNGVGLSEKPFHHGGLHGI